MQTIILKCKPNAQFHFGRITLGEDATNLDDTSDYLHSDTLFSALINTAAMLYDKKEVNEFVEEFKNGNLIISSAFYCLEIGEKWIYFLPKPVTCSILELPESEHQFHKKYKKVAFISQTVWQKGIEPKDWNKECVFIQDHFLIHKDELQEYKTEEIEKLHIFSKISLPKVKVSTQDPKNRLYNQTNISIADNKPFKVGKEKVFPNIHFYFLVKSKDEEANYYKRLKLILEILADTGIGGERSVGCGKLEGIEIRENNFTVEEVDKNGFGAISLVIPKEKEFETVQYYDLITRGGRVIGKLPNEELERLKRIKMLKEGAVLQTEILGAASCISPNDDIYLRNGLCFSLPLHKNYFI
ncbi:type III-A CRISPR-associated RAMP protein Csm4 [Bernardetia sp. MNP-M8]|uniref:type III-A CRISPR-associated RAMP protein Csm4 n=1 Tax=Bernardetia sp. MNP-M8 TaxID=3127470 RepID=UPI0030D4C3A3